MTIPYNEPAFPISDCSAYQYDGMSLRDWFAGHALSGISSVCNDDVFMHTGAIIAAKLAYSYADAMLAERAKVKP
jgi:hypothetical protein